MVIWIKCLKSVSGTDSVLDYSSRIRHHAAHSFSCCWKTTNLLFSVISEPYLSKYSVEILSSPSTTGGPWVLQFDNLLSKTEADHLIELGGTFWLDDVQIMDSTIRSLDLIMFWDGTNSYRGLCTIGRCWKNQSRRGK